MSEWFYLKQWRLNRKNIWCVIDMSGNILLENVNRHIADSKQEALSLIDVKVYVVNKHDPRYTSLVSKNRGKNENSFAKRWV
jgi:hypothetical protein